MFKTIALILIIIGVYIGVTYKETITDTLGNEQIESIQEKVNNTLENGKEAASKAIDEFNN